MSRIVLAALLFIAVYAASFNIQVTSVCTNYTGTVCTTWSQTGTIIEETAACLPGSALVLTDRGSRRMSELKIGDRIFSYNRSTGKHEYSTVEAWLHRAPQKSDKFLKLESPDLTLTVSEMHNVANAAYSFSFAKAMLGKQLFGNLTEQKVQRITETTEVGVFSPLTLNNNFFVIAGKGLVLVHCYAHISSPELYEPYFTPIVRLYEYFFPYAQTNSEWMHPVARWSKGILQMLAQSIEL